MTVSLVIGAGGIGQAVIEQLLQNDEQVLAVSRASLAIEHPYLHHFHGADSEAGIDALIDRFKDYRGEIGRVIITSGLLHQDDNPPVFPEKRLEDISADQWLQVFTVNTVLPALWVARLLPLLKGKQPCVMTVLSARVGSIADNRLGGWYSYRSTKAALNMALKTAAIEYARRAPNVKLLAFHPGTTDTDLSKPFQGNVSPDKLFAPAFVSRQLLGIMDDLQPDGELSYLDWQGQAIPW